MIRLRRKRATAAAEQQATDARAARCEANEAMFDSQGARR